MSKLTLINPGFVDAIYHLDLQNSLLLSRNCISVTILFQNKYNRVIEKFRWSESRFNLDLRVELDPLPLIRA